MARTAESGSACAARNRDTMASREGFEVTASSFVNSGKPSERSIAPSPFLCYLSKEAAALLVLPNEFVSLERRRNLKCARFRSGILPFRTEYLPDTPQIHRLRTIVIQSNHIFNGAAEIGLALRGEQHPAGADVSRESRCNHA